MNRLELAWQRRKDIFEFVKAHPGRKISDIIAKFSNTHNETIRKAVYSLSSLGYLLASGRSPREFIYHAADVSFYSVADAKKRNVENALAASRNAKARNKTDKPQPEPWRTVHLMKDTDKPIPNQGGQGALRRTVTVNCENY